MPAPAELDFFTRRFHAQETHREGDVRTAYERDRARVIHSAAFRRLQAKTQVMGIGEGDFHRTRLTHSIECAQIGTGLVDAILRRDGTPDDLDGWLPPRELMETACYAHDLGHPPFGHGGETALHREMRSDGGFEGNGQTLRILARLEKHGQPGWGTNPTRRLVLAVLKYPIPYSAFDTTTGEHPPKCYLDDEAEVVDWALDGFSEGDRARLHERSARGKALHRTLDCSAMELADDIAYGVHDIEDIVARRMAHRDEVQALLDSAFGAIGGRLDTVAGSYDANSVGAGLFDSSYTRKQIISRLVGTFITHAQVRRVDGFDHPLLGYRVGLPYAHRTLLDQLQQMSFALAIDRPAVRQLERRGQRVVSELFQTFLESPTILIPDFAEEGDAGGGIPRRVCDYVAGMTDSYAEKVYKRLFIPGFGTSNDLL